MPVNKNTLPTEGSPKTVTALIGAKTISAAYAYKHGSVKVVEFLFSDASTNFIKIGAGGVMEIGGTLEFNTGTQLTW